MPHLTIPNDFPVRPLADDAPAKDRVTCGECGLSWDDAISTASTPAPSGRCPFEYFHLSDAEQFFYDNAEYSWNPAIETQEQGRARGARELAAAEQRMNDGPYYVTEEPDPEGIDWDNGYDGDVWVVQLWKNVDEETYGDYPLGSLGGVACDEDSPYLRVVAANLALKTIPA